MCNTKAVQFGASIQYLGKGIIDGPLAGDPRNGVARQLVLDASPLNFSYITGRELRTYLVAGGKRIDYTLTASGNTVKIGDGGHTPLFAVNNDVYPTKQYLVVFVPEVNASIDGDSIRVSNYTPEVYITYQGSDDVVARRLNLDIHFYQQRNNIILTGQGLDIVQNKSSVFHFSPCPTVIREIDGLLERCKYSGLSGVSNVNYFTDYFGLIPTISTGHNPRSFSYETYLKAKASSVVSYSTYASNADTFSASCSRVLAQEQVESGRPVVNNPLVPPSQSNDYFDLIDIEDTLVGTPISITLPRVSRIHNRFGNGRIVEFPKGYFFADSNGIFYMNSAEEKVLLFSPQDIPNRVWFD